jgi:predicted ester cyclase
MGYLKSKVQRTYDVLNDGNIVLVDELYARDFFNRTTPSGVAPTRDGYKLSVIALRTAFPDIHYTIDDLIESDDKFVTRVTASGTMRGEFAGVPPTGKHATWTEIHILRFTDELVVEHWGLVDQLGMMIQLDVIPAPGRLPVEA